MSIALSYQQKFCSKLETYYFTWTKFPFVYMPEQESELNRKTESFCTLSFQNSPIMISEV